ncbi:anti-sigma factor family protein [Candidatus Nitrospira bockiana]
MLSCQDATRLFSDSMDRALPLRQRAALRLHFLLCKFCDRYRKQLLLVKQAMGRHPDRLEPPDTPSLSPEARERIKHLLSGHE